MPDPDKVSLLYHLEARLEAMEKAVGMANKALDIRLEHMNEFRDQIERERKEYVRRIEFDMEARKVRDLELSRAELAGKASQASVNVALIMAIAGLIVGALGIFLK